ncbi:ADP-ribose pyrophosphatase [Saccharibacillus sp. O23]|uniref:NUDIX hydrolase n=1 Tax=Saccharibacillus sp. O23 TaxID=2009338 RepID=UPI000B4DF6B4|nr:NUDIX hydrolase [Saccharibacillus sp. O23]OWR32343.1 ADP-ribose pyrophosphatase [Saccharibacillus sp. O23]
MTNLDYMRELRRQVGSRPLIMCGASVLIFDEQGRVLMLHRNDNDTWCFPGGAMELGESTEQTARREAYEETGLRVEQLELFGVFSGEGMRYVYPNGDEVHNVDVVYRTNIYDGELRLDHENRAYRFFDLDELPERISPPVLPVVRQLSDQGNRA